jgi:hypothetical protein
MFEEGEWTLELIIYLLYLFNCDFDVGEAMFEDVETPFERIFYILGIQKTNSTKLVK